MKDGLDRVARAQALWQEGKSAREIAKELGVTKTTAYGWATGRAKQPRDSMFNRTELYRSLDPDQRLARAQEMHVGGMNAVEIAEAFGISKAQAGNWVYGGSPESKAEQRHKVEAARIARERAKIVDSYVNAVLRIESELTLAQKDKLLSMLRKAE